MRARLMGRSLGTRTAPVDSRQRRIESLAAEFALLAQRRARVIHQMDLLDQQREAAAVGFHKLQARMAWLVQRIDALDPALRETLVEAEVVAPPSLVQPVAHMPVRAAKPAASTFAAHVPGAKLNPAGANRTLNGRRPAPGGHGIGANKWRT